MYTCVLCLYLIIVTSVHIDGRCTNCSHGYVKCNLKEWGVRGHTYSCCAACATVLYELSFGQCDRSLDIRFWGYKVRPKFGANHKPYIWLVLVYDHNTIKDYLFYM